MKHAMMIFAILGLAVLPGIRSGAEQPAQVPSTTAAVAATVHGTVRSIRLPELQAELPDGPHRDEAVVYCGMCHTTHYIMIQPPFPRQTWLAEVTKMRTSFNGPIPPEKVQDLVDYLMTVRGAPEPHK